MRCSQTLRHEFKGVLAVLKVWRVPLAFIGFNRGFALSPGWNGRISRGRKGRAVSSTRDVTRCPVTDITDAEKGQGSGTGDIERAALSGRGAFRQCWTRRVSRHHAAPLLGQVLSVRRWDRSPNPSRSGCVRTSEHQLAVSAGATVVLHRADGGASATPLPENFPDNRSHSASPGLLSRRRRRYRHHRRTRRLATRRSRRSRPTA